MKILVVDDNADDRRVLRYIIEAHGHEVVVAGDGQEGLAMAASCMPDLIISDALMPVTDGYQFLRNIKQDERLSSIPFIFYSATYKGGRDVELAISLGASGFIIKPKEPAELWEEVEQIFAESRQEKVITPSLIEENTEYLKRYSDVVATKLEEKVRELESALEERKVAERSIALMSFALDNVSEAAFLIDGNARFQYVNGESCRKLGYSREELLGLTVADVDPDLPISRWPEHWRALKEKGSLIFEGRHRTRDGSMFPVEISANYFEYEGSGYNLALVRDITERKKIEETLRSSQQNLALHVMQTPLGVIEWDLSFKVAKWNPAAERIFGYSRNEALGLHASFIVPPIAREQVEHIWRDLIQKKGGLRSTNENVTKDGKLIYCEWYNTPLVDADGKVIAVASLVQDISERRAAEEALRKSQAFNRSILDSVDEGFIVIDREYRILSANRAFCNMVNLSENSIEGRKCHEVTHNLMHPCFEEGEECPVRRTFETGKGYSVSHTHEDAGGSRQYVELKSYPITDESEKVISVIETLNDVTDKKKLEEQLRQAQKMEAIGTLAGGVAHDFNNMLTAIFGYGEIIKMTMEPDDPHHAAVDQIMRAAQRAADLTQGLLAFSRKQVLDTKPVEVNSIVRNVEKLLLRLIGEDIDLSTHLADEELIVMADAGQIEQVLMNLATNARDAMPRGGALTISTEMVELTPDFISTHGYSRPGRHALISVSDAGCGMDAGTREKIFEPFFTTKERGKGTGLGLSIVYGIIKQHNGNINVYSEPGKGTIFRIYLPMITPQKEDLQAEAVSLPLGGTETILLAEDDHTVREMISSVLTSAGYKVIDAIDGQDAIAEFEKNADRIDLMILDVIMPKKTGKDVYDAISSRRPDMAVLFISGYASDMVYRKNIHKGRGEFISKPVGPREIMQKVRYLLDKKNTPFKNP